VADDEDGCLGTRTCAIKASDSLAAVTTGVSPSRAASGAAVWRVRRYSVTKICLIPAAASIEASLAARCSPGRAECRIVGHHSRRRRRR
jgi:hypothetical protein